MRGTVVDNNELTALIRRRVESRYRRVCHVRRELAKLSEQRNEDGETGVYNGSFDDFVFSSIDFSVYHKIAAEEFNLLFDEGLSDYDEDFYHRAFGTNRDNIRQTIFRSYIHVGPFYVCKRANPLILSIMRSVHISLDFAPLLSPADLNEGERNQYPALVAALSGVVIRHNDGMETRLFAPGPDEGAFMSGAALCGTFHPEGKAHTIILIR
jgi:hypothetical protein